MIEIHLMTAGQKLVQQTSSLFRPSRDKFWDVWFRIESLGAKKRRDAAFLRAAQCVSSSVIRNSTPITQVPAEISFVLPVKRRMATWLISPNAMPKEML